MILAKAGIIRAHDIYTPSLSADGYVSAVASTWNAVRAATYGNLGVDFLSNVIMCSVFYSDGFVIRRGFLYFDLTNLVGTIKKVTLYIYGTTYAQSEISAQKGTQGDILSPGDFDAFSGDEYGHTLLFGIDKWNPIEFNSIGLADVQNALGSMLKICCREYNHDYLNISGTAFRNHFYARDNANFWPRLEIVLE